MAVKAVEIRAELRQVKTMVDHTVNVTLNLPEDCIEQVKVLLDWLGLEVGVVIANTDLIAGEEQEHGSKGRKRKIHQRE